LVRDSHPASHLSGSNTAAPLTILFNFVLRITLLKHEIFYNLIIFCKILYIYSLDDCRCEAKLAAIITARSFIWQHPPRRGRFDIYARGGPKFAHLRRRGIYGTTNRGIAAPAEKLCEFVFSPLARLREQCKAQVGPV
jgi:hypothetical protein